MRVQERNGGDLNALKDQNNKGACLISHAVGPFAKGCRLHYQTRGRACVVTMTPQCPASLLFSDSSRAVLCAQSSQISPRFAIRRQLKRSVRMRPSHSSQNPSCDVTVQNLGQQSPRRNEGEPPPPPLQRRSSPAPPPRLRDQRPPALLAYRDRNHTCATRDRRPPYLASDTHAIHTLVVCADAVGAA